MMESLAMLNKVNRLCQKFPGLDCGSCGAPTCKALAEDIVRGNATQNDCIYVLKNHIHKLMDNANTLANNIFIGGDNAKEYIYILKQYITQLSSDISLLDASLNPSSGQEDGDGQEAD